MTYQEILEGITQHRAKPIDIGGEGLLYQEVDRKVNEIEWALQALAERGRDDAAVIERLFNVVDRLTTLIDKGQQELTKIFMEKAND